MRLDHQTRRAAMLQAFRAYRIAQPDSPLRCAYLFADSMIKPLPEDRLTFIIRETMRGYQHGMRNYPNADARACWKMAYGHYREEFNLCHS